MFIRSVCSLLLLFVASGCTGAKAPTGDQASVSGSVTVDGKPITVDSSVVFYSKDGGSTAAGMIDSLGKFSLKGGDPSKGIPPGRYAVMVRPPEKAAVQPGTDEYKKAMMAGMQSPKGTAAPPSDIPAQFMAFETSGLVVEVKTGPNTFDFALDKLTTAKKK